MSKLWLQTCFNYSLWYAVFDEKMEEDIKSKKIALGGCCITEYDPIWKRTNCNTDFWKEGQGLKINLEELLIQK